MKFGLRRGKLRRRYGHARRYGHSSGGKSIYEQLRDAGCVLDHHESDLYVRDSKTARSLLRMAGKMFSTFRSEIDGQTWLDVPFAYDPWWQKRSQ